MIDDSRHRSSSAEVRVPSITGKYQKVDDNEPSPDCTDMEEWEILINVLVNQILWDDDYDMDGYRFDPKKWHFLALSGNFSAGPDYRNRTSGRIWNELSGE
jgi:hypothetical protein